MTTDERATQQRTTEQRATDGIEAVFLETHNWGATARFLQSLGYELDFETDHHSGQLSNGIGPSIFVAEVPPTADCGVRLVLRTEDADALRLDAHVEVVEPFTDTHWGTRQMVVRDPDGRLWSVQAPGPASGGEGAGRG